MLIEQLIQPFLEGTLVTLQVFTGTLVVSFPLALLLASIQRLKNPLINSILRIYIIIERGTPLLLQMMFIFFGLPYLGITLDRTTSIYVAFILNYTAYFLEIIRGGIQSVDSSQHEAAQVLGYSKSKTYSRIILPQAIVNCFPSISNEVLTLIKDTSLINILGASELLKAGRNAVNTYATAVPFIYVGIIYLCMTFILEIIMKNIERKIDCYK